MFSEYLFLRSRGSVARKMISIVYNVKGYRELLNKQIKKGDIVIELGPHVGKSTLSYVERTGLTVAVDISPQSEKGFEGFQGGFPNLRFIRGDARSFDTVGNVLKLTGKCNLLAVDLGGGRYPDTVFKVWAIWSGVFKPENSVIRNRGLAEFAQRVKIQDESLRREFEDDGWLSLWGRQVPSKLREQLDEFKFWVDVE